MRNYTLMLIAALIMEACNPAGDQSNSAVSKEIPLTYSIIPDKTPRIFKGMYVFGHEVRTFQDCNDSQKTYWVIDSLSHLQKAYEENTKFLSYPYESVYAEVKGYLAGKSQMGFAADYENVLIVTELIKIEAKNFRTDCYDYEFIALGNEPFWSIDIIPNEKRIIFKDAGNEKVYEFIYLPATIKDGVYRYQAINSKNEKLDIIIREEKCSDGMSDRQYNYSAEIKLNGDLFKGCAIKKGEQFNDRP